MANRGGDEGKQPGVIRTPKGTGVDGSGVDDGYVARVKTWLGASGKN